MRIAGIFLWVAVNACGQELPVVDVVADETIITRSCRIRIAPGAVIPDPNGNGVIHIRTPGIVVEFLGDSVLVGDPDERAADGFAGFGIRIRDAEGVTLRGARVAGYRVGIFATGAPGLVLEDCDVSGNFRQRLRSTPKREHGGDWISPHENDGNEWITRYGAGIYVEESRRVTIRRCRARRGQNGLVLDRVDHGRVYDNDFSFLSGWGIALWRSSDNVVSRNACDFCVRGYSHGVYNRGQDSAGILMFEQCNRNVIAENSATHGGDGFFGFAGKEALGENTPPSPDYDHWRRGNNDNLLIANDFSYAPAHGIEMTFSFGNRFIGNRLVENAICGVWGGYSKDTLIEGNDFVRNGDMAYGLERGGVNIEHGSRNRIVRNRFIENRCGVHLWWDDDGRLLRTPWALANGGASSDNVIAHNRFRGDTVGLHLRDSQRTFVQDNELRDVAKPVDATRGAEPVPCDDLPPGVVRPTYESFGETEPRGAREHLRGRDKIIMTEWGPWDHETMLVRPGRDLGHTHEWIIERPAPGTSVVTTGKDLVTETRKEESRWVVTVSAQSAGAFPYLLDVLGGPEEFRQTSCIVRTEWAVTVFPYDVKTHDPREKLAEWRALAKDGKTSRRPHLDLTWAMKGPAELARSDYFGTIARTSLRLPAGRWKVTCLSDDGVRILADGKLVLERWTHHGPTKDEGIIDVEAPRTVELHVEHFELNGYAVLDVEITRHVR